jgi:hypothetical protein
MIHTKIHDSCGFWGRGQKNEKSGVGSCGGVEVITIQFCLTKGSLLLLDGKNMVFI